MSNRPSVIRILAASTACLGLGACGGPSEEEVAQAVGQRNVSNVSCVEAVGQLGYMCSFHYLTFDLTRRLVKNDDGRWRVIY